MRIAFIINPTAGKGRAAKTIPEIERTMNGLENVEYSLLYTEKPGHAMSIAKDAASSGTDIVFAVGGDGTVNEVMNGLLDTSTALAVLPCGSGNDFIRSLGISGKTDKIIKDAVNGLKRLIDVGHINDRFFVNIASAGFDAEVVLATQKAKRFMLSGSAAYIAGLIWTIFSYKASAVRINLTDKVMEEKVLLMAVANGKYYGGGMMAAPDAELDDGYFDICIIKSMPKWKMLALFPQFMKGKHKKFKEVSFHRSDTVSIESDKGLAVNVDGEVFRDTRASFKMVKKGLYVMAPNI